MARLKLRHLALLLLIQIVVGCSGHTVEDSAPASGSATPPELPGDAVPRKEARSRYGNGPYYEVYGVQYQVLDSSFGYRERGVASWYGEKFHGRATSSQEPYDMYAMTAAHKTLPLPTYVRVTNLRNNKSIVVRVNDRGPFVDNRIIDLSYAAAMRLDMVRDGTSLVEVTAISYDEPSATDAKQAASTMLSERGEPQNLDERQVFVQVGAFGDADNANRQFVLLKESGVGPAYVHEDDKGTEALYRVRVGPIADAEEYDTVVARLAQIGISETHLVTE